MAGLQIHQQERQIVDNVNPTEGLIELNAIEHRHLVIEHRDVGQVQIAMALPDQSAGAAGGNQLPVSIKGGLGPGFLGVELP